MDVWYWGSALFREGARVKTANVRNIHLVQKNESWVETTHRSMHLKGKGINEERRKGMTRDSDKMALASTLMCSKRAQPEGLVYSSARSCRMGKRIESSLGGREKRMKDAPFSFARAG